VRFDRDYEALAAEPAAPKPVIPDNQAFGGVMDNRSILEKIADTVKDIAAIAATAADYALKVDERPLKAGKKTAKKAARKQRRAIRGEH
jgi:hypothetical protein